jgi:hypothetical protein
VSHGSVTANSDLIWVRCLVNAVHFLHELMLGDVLPAELLTEMDQVLPLGGPLPNRPWETTGYGLGFICSTSQKTVINPTRIITTIVAPCGIGEATCGE